MTDEELICNLVKRLTLNVFRLVGNFPSAEQKCCEVAGFLCRHSTEDPVTSLGGGVTCSVTQPCAVGCRRSSISSSPLGLLLHINPGTNMPDSGCLLLALCWCIRHCNNSTWLTANYSLITGEHNLTIYMCFWMICTMWTRKTQYRHSKAKASLEELVNNCCT